MNQVKRRAIMERIYESLKEWGYRPMDQLISYIWKKAVDGLRRKIYNGLD